MACTALCQQPKTLSLAVSAALTGFGITVMLAAPIQANTISISVPSYTNSTQQSTIVINSGVTIGPWATAFKNSSVTLGTLNNSGFISGHPIGVYNHGRITTLINSGTISGTLVSPQGTGIYNVNAIGTLTNTGLISGAVNGIYNDGISPISIISNSGIIHGGGNAIYNISVIGTLNNTGTISAGSYGIFNLGSIGSLINSGSIQGIINDNNTIATLNNSGSISSAPYGAIDNYKGAINTLVNSGVVSSSNIGINNNTGTIATLTNSGTITAATGIGTSNGGRIGTLINSGTITGSHNGILNNSYDNINTLTNSLGGVISGGSYGVSNNGGTIGTLSNSGTVSGSIYGVYNAGTIAAIINSGNLNSLYNDTSGTINAGVGYGVNNSGGIGTLSNSGSITGLYGIYNNSGTINALINLGTLSGTSGGIYNAGTINTLTNGQVGLTYHGNLPSSYNSYFASGSYTPSSSFASTVFSSTGSSSIASYGIQLAASGVTLAAGTYYDVLQSSTAFTVVNVGQMLYYTQNGYHITYKLLADGNNYDLVIEGATSGGGSGTGAGTGGFSQAVTGQHNSPAYYAARIIDGNSNISNLFTSVSGSSTATQSAAVSQSLPLVTGGATSVTQTALTSVNTIIDARQSANRGASSGDDFQTSRSMWLKAFGTEADQSDLDGVSGFKAHTGGVTFGADEKVTDKLTLGAAFAYANSNVSSTVGGASQGMNIKGYQLIGYGSLALNNRDSVDFQLDGGMSSNSGSRNISFLNEVASSSYDSWSAHLGSSLNRRYDLSEKLTLTPSLRVDYTRINESGYQESGAGDLDLNVNSQHAEALVFGVDGKLDYKLSDTLAVAANLGVGYDAMNKQDSIVAAYAGASTASFVTEGLNQGALISRAGVMLSYKLPKGMEVSAHYDVEGRRNYLSQTASVKFSMPF